MNHSFFISILFLLIGWHSYGQKSIKEMKPRLESENVQNPLILNYRGTPNSEYDKSFLMYSDQGAWFAYSLPDKNPQGGFSGPFLMTQNNGVWSSKSLVRLKFLNSENEVIDDWEAEKNRQNASLAHLEFSYGNDVLNIVNKLFYPTPNTAAIKVVLTNISDKITKLSPVVQGELLPESLYFDLGDNNLKIKSTIGKTTGYLRLPKDFKNEIVAFSDSSYTIKYDLILLSPGEKHEFVYTQSFLFPDKEWEKESKSIGDIQTNFNKRLTERKTEKQQIIQKVKNQIAKPWKKSAYFDLAKKLILTLQNNWRSAAGGLEHAGLFPSYHYKWFQGFWAWDSWKHAAALAAYNSALAKEQVLAMYDYQTETGFIPDVVYRNNLIEENNYRNTKPPLSGWAVWRIYEEDGDIDFLKKLYPKIKKQHYWWYHFRDHDNDGVCEYGSTDGSLIAAKWESGMDNAVRFDHSKLLRNSESAFSLNQESVDLNSYLYAEKIYLSKIAYLLQRKEDKNRFLEEAANLKKQIQSQFYDEDSGWFYDTTLDGKNLIKVMGPEGWIPLWANVAFFSQAKEVHKNMIDPELFNTQVPLQTLSASHKKFEPDGGYWRGPTWIDQAYFGVNGLKNYGFDKDANKLTYKLIHNAEGVLEAGKSIRENYNPITGEGLESKNFSWSAAHFLLLLLNK